MFSRLSRGVAIALIAGALSACSSTSDLGAGKTGKSFTVQGKSYDAIWNAAVTAVQGTEDPRALDISRNLQITKQNKQQGRIEATTGMSLWSFGEVVGVYISPPADAPQHVIEVESLSKLKTNITSNNWEDEVIAAIQSELGR